MKPLVTTLALVPSLVWAQSYSRTGPSVARPQAELGHHLQGDGQDQIATFVEVEDRKKAITHCTFDKSTLGRLDNSVTRHNQSDIPFDAGVEEQAEPMRFHEKLSQSRAESWTGGLSRLRVRSSHGMIDYGSAVCVGYGRRPGEWTFLSCSHNLESGGVPELFVRGEWIAANVLYRDELAPAVQTGPGQYTRVSDGPDRSVLIITHPDSLPFRPVSLERYTGLIALSGFPSTKVPVIISGRTRPHQHGMSAALERPSEGGFSGGGVFNEHRELIGIWTSGFNGNGYGHYVLEFVPIFQQLGWTPGNWPALPDTPEQMSLTESLAPVAMRNRRSTGILESPVFAQ